MKKVLLLVIALAISCWAIPKPMESVENYNVVLVHGAYQADKGEPVRNSTLNEAYYTESFLGDANLGQYNSSNRITRWLAQKVFEEENYEKNVDKVRNSYVYHWRSFSNPANTSHNNAYEMADRTWNMAEKGVSEFGKRRALFEEAQEVKSSFYSVSKDDTLHGQEALDSIRQDPDLFRKLASRYVLVSHSMGGVVSREYVQGNFYNGDVDKIITLDSPHEGTGALNMLIKKSMREETVDSLLHDNRYNALHVAMAVASAILFIKGSELAYKWGAITYLLSFLNDGLGNILTRLFADDLYYYEDPLVHYVDPLQIGYQTIDSLNNLEYENKVDLLPMFRILASQHGMTFTDPDRVNYGILGFLREYFPDNIMLPFANFGRQLFYGTGDFSACNVNAVVSYVLGIYGMPVQENGSSIVPASSSEGRYVAVLNDSKVDVERKYFNGAPYSTNDFGNRAAILGIATDAMLAADLLAYIFSPATIAAAKLGIVMSYVVGAVNSIALAAGAGAKDLMESHNIALQWRNLDTMKVAKKSFTPISINSYDYDKPYLMEDFLYEKPFVNLALNDSRTMGLLAQDSSLNPNCYFESDSLKKVPLCEVGLYGNRDSVAIDPITMKETPVYNAAVAKTDSAGNVVHDSSGKVVYDSVYYGTFEQRKYSDFRNSPLKFKSESDWYKVGVKVDRWERVDGLHPDGSENKKGVPIRHVERYNVPDIVATGFIEKYSFVVDDLMPHRMRQIKMTFNSNEEVAWECNIKAAEDDPHACAVYKRLLGNSWGNPDTTIGDKGYVPHPIKKNGRFDFDARKYFDNLASIQKDNQNTVLISMVNKIGLSNTQRFYYLFKATDNMLQPTWPLHDVVLNAIDGFGVYVSALDYQGFRVRSAKDGIFSDPLGTPTQVGDSLPMVMTEFQGTNAEGKDISSAVFASKQNISAPAEGAYRWVVDAVVNNNARDSSKTDSYEVHFVVDRTAPAFTLTSDAMMNPDSSMFITRFKWVGKDSADRARGSDIRVMRWTLEKANGQPSGGSHVTFTKYAELPALYDVASNEFAIAWDKVPQGKRDSIESGLYRIAAYAIDYAVPNLDAYHKVNALVDGIFSNPQDTSVWGGIDSLRLNDTTIYAEFRVDHSAPSFTFRETRAVTAADTVNYGTYVNLSGKYDALRASRPARNADWTYISKDSLLQIGYTVMDSLNGLDSAAVTVGWNFVHIPDTNVIDRAGDSVWVFDSLGGKSSGTWTEMAGLRMADGEYSVHAVLRDAAKNVHHDSVPKRVRVDRTAPQIVGLTSDHLVYMDKDGDFSATIIVSEKADIGVNRTGMHCSYRVLGGADSSWYEIRKGDRKLLANDTVKFSIAKASVDTARGIRYLEAACVDAAGNVSVRTDLFHVGARFPQITYPQADSIQSDQNYIPIVGIAPKTSSADSLSSVYRLRYRVGNDTTWKTDKIKVVAANRSASADLNLGGGGFPLVRTSLLSTLSSGLQAPARNARLSPPARPLALFIMSFKQSVISLHGFADFV